MSKLALAAVATSKFLLYALPVLFGLHLLALALYAALVRDWSAVKPLLPRNLKLTLAFVLCFLVIVPLHQRAERWRYAEAYGVAARIEAELAAGHYESALKARQAMTVASPARDELDKQLQTYVPRMLTEGITRANQGDYLGATQLVSLTPDAGPTAKKRARLLEWWAPYAARQRAGQASQQAALDQRFLSAAKAPLEAYDRLARETLPRALQLDPTATTRVNGRPVHPLAPVLLGASVKAKEIEGEAHGLAAPSTAEAALRNELTLAANAFKRGCEESLSYANSADRAPAERARKAFSEASSHRGAVDRLLGGLDATSALPSAVASKAEGRAPEASPGQAPTDESDTSALAPSPAESGVRTLTPPLSEGEP